MRRNAAREQAQEIRHSDFIAAVVHLDVVAVKVGIFVHGRPNGAWEWVPRVARRVLGQHEDDMAVGNTEPLHGAVHPQGIRHVLRERNTYAVVKPELACTHEHGPIVRVRRGARRSTLRAALRHRRFAEKLGDCGSLLTANK